jgi:hypothetical protein
MHFHSFDIAHWPDASDGHSIVPFARPSLAPLTLVLEQSGHHFIRLGQGRLGEHISVIRMLQSKKEPANFFLISSGTEFGYCPSWN